MDLRSKNLCAETDLYQAGCALPERQMLEELMDECVRFYEIWIWEIATYTQE